MPQVSRTQQSSPWLNHQLRMYSLAAGATGVGLLALTPPASAEIVYTPANVTISTKTLHSYSLDLNGDGVTDFFISAVGHESIDTSGFTSKIFARAVQGNGAVGYGGRAAALAAGQNIGSSRKFQGEFMATLHTFIGTELSFHGAWANVKNRYLGLQFQIDGETHYGWARLSVGGAEPLSARLTGYAYETSPNTPIVAGKTSGAHASMRKFPAEPQTDLGTLAAGAPALSLCRKEAWGKEERGSSAVRS
ncbi:MAG TPA: hypothetical protein VND65_02100 [Candidatus Binatia bacterium]|nr:hypothetical protein [Candidatus Binatia bacterium]